MSYFQRLRSAFSGLLILLYVVILLLLPEQGYALAVLLLSISLLIKGVRKLIYYFTLARHMVGGKSVLYHALIMIDLSIFTIHVASMTSLTILIYLLGIYVFSGAVDILRALEARKYGTHFWKLKLINGIIGVAFALVLFVIGISSHSTILMLIGYCITLVYSAVLKILSAFRKTAIVYIQ